jgi:hypothetical protein
MEKNKIKENGKNRLFIYGIYTKILNNEKHYTVLQANLKSGVAYWLLIIIAALGMIYSYRESSLPFERLLSTLAVCAIGLIGVNIIWYDDVIIQERFLTLNTLEAFRLENIYSWLPQVHHQQFCFTHRSMIKFKHLFYFGCNFILFVIFIISISLYLSVYNFLVVLISDFFIIALFLIFSRLMFTRAYKNELITMKEFVYGRK